MNRFLGCLLLSLVTIAVACGGGSPDAGVVSGASGSSVISAGFAADQANPGANTVSMAQGPSSGALVTVLVNVTDTNGVFSAAFDLFFDPAVAEYVSWSPGTILETGGHSPNYSVASFPGHLVIGAARQGNVPVVDVVGTRPLIAFTFRLKQAGSSQITFQAPSLFDNQIPPQKIPGVSWFGGSLAGS